MIEFVAAAGLVALVVKLVEFLQAARNGEWNVVVTLPIVWAAGIAGVLLFAASDWGSAIEVGGLTLGEMNAASLVIAGFAVGSTGSAAYDVLPMKNAGPLVKEGEQ